MNIREQGVEEFLKANPPPEWGILVIAEAAMPTEEMVEATENKFFRDFNLEESMKMMEGNIALVLFVLTMLQKARTHDQLLTLKEKLGYIMSQLNACITVKAQHLKHRP